MAIRRAGRMIVAYSGGIDSAYLAFAAHRVLGDGMLAVIADSPSLARSHYREALEFATAQGIPLKTVETAEMEREAYAVNDANRCFHCKDELFTVLEHERVALGFETVAYGLNLDDRKDFRPGQQAAEAHRVAAPLAEARLTKADVRALAQSAGLSIWDKPASACLSSRLEYGRRVTPENLRMVEEAEDALRLLGLRRFRVRHHGAMARVEIAEEELAAGLSRERMREISAAVRASGFQYVAVDCDGYRSGAMNEVLPVELLLKAGRTAN
ncbi:ATP-dependent sacrificial sulfur transferase LarE [Silvibacterium sp.]|uniref:ATP-dependent sacrificial sulfur transferase LarE n=1 Tax=Silvibacterium sp. TaxID=1964179 RepID=UPI0039E70568